MKKITALKKKSVSELSKELIEKRKAIQDLRFGVSGAKVKNVKASKEAKRDVARILTLLRTASNSSPS
jgi:ribosomal protein L29